MQRQSTQVSKARMPRPAGPAGERPALDPRPSTLDPPRGFTLVELMIVITVIAILIALVGAVLANMGQQAKEAATMATIKKIHAQLEQRMESFDREMERLETYARSGQSQSKAAAYHFRLVEFQRDLVNEGGPSLSTDALIILVHKTLMKEKFPQTYGESTSISNSTVASAADSSELLYLTLTEGESGGAATVDAGEFLASETGDTDDDGRLEFIDAWGNPLRFYRWPTRLLKLNGTDHTDDDHERASLLIQGLPDHAQEAMLTTDPHDPLGLLAPAIAYYDTTSEDFESRYHTTNTYFLPLIVSAGADGELGMGEASGPDSTALSRLAQVDSSNVDALYDNITNRNQRAGD